jgi:hypothetical protein
MADNEFDDLFNKRLHQYEGDVPADMWQRIAGEKKKRRGVYIWRHYFIALLLLLLVTGMYRFYTGLNEKNTGGNINNDIKNKVQPLTTINDTSNTNEEVSSPDINKINAITPSKKLTTNHTLNRLLFSKNKITADSGNQIFAESYIKELPEQEEQNTAIYNKFIGDTIKTSIQKKPALTQTANKEDSNESSTKENEAPDKISLQVFGSPDIPFSSIHSSNSNYEKLLRNAVNMRLSYTIGVGISFAFSRKISLSSGIQYSRVNEAISYDSIQPGSSSIRNHFSFINVPVIISYHTGWTSSFQTSLEAGVLFNISSKYTRFMPDVFGGVTDISHGVYERNTGVSIYTAVNFSKPVTNKLDVFAEPYFRFQTKNIADNIQPFTRKIQTAGLALGIQLKLFKDEKK